MTVVRHFLKSAFIRSDQQLGYILVYLHQLGALSLAIPEDQELLPIEPSGFCRKGFSTLKAGGGGIEYPSV